MNYSEDTDLLEIRPRLFDLCVEGVGDKHSRAKELIDRDLKIKWYRTAIDGRLIDIDVVPSFILDLDQFNPALLLNGVTQLKRASVFKVLELVYMSLQKEVQDDPFALQAMEMRTLYEGELDAVISSGIDYDFDEDGNISTSETNIRPRQGLRLVRA